MGFGNGPLIAAGAMAGGAALFVGWGLTQLATSDGGFTRALPGNHAPAEAPGNPDEKHAGGSSAQQPNEGAAGKQDESGSSPTPGPGRGGEDEPNGSDARTQPAPKAKPPTVTPSDTLAAISGATGVPIDILIEAKKILNPDFIHAWASRLLPPA
ncbi:LysM domain-containing protein [Streptomyces sp. 2P-4]|uniref:LysM peptidoglycan-binding domain-containing protein n=1 Tax=Streptomyces sp. 2P-4 TaxID=2931974 RepID=UPI00253F8714|nr:LysM domain-containing protein [Streptomyces sp. 2P-4]